MNKLLAGIIAITLSTQATAQSPKLNFQYGDSYDLPKSPDNVAYFGSKSQGLVNVTVKKDDVTLFRFDPSTLKKLQEEKIKLKVSKNYNSETGVRFQNGNSFWIYSDWDKKAEKEYVFYDKINLINGKTEEANTTMVETSRVAGKYIPASIAGPSKVINKYRFSMDETGSKFGILYQYVPEVKDNKKSYARIGIHVYDNNLKKLWSNDFVMPETEANLSFTHFTVDSKGNVYLFVQRSIATSSGKGSSTDIFKFSGGEKKAKMMALKTNENLIEDIRILETQNGKIMLAGLYSPPKLNGIAGTFYATLENDQFKLRYATFPRREIVRYLNPKAKTKAENAETVAIPNLKVRDILVEKDGSMLITTEEFAEGGNGNGVWQAWYVNIYAIKMKPDGELDWVKKIPKHQRGDGPRGSMSFKFFHDTNGYHFLYVDNLKNLTLTEDEDPVVRLETSDGRLVLATISNDGQLSKKEILNTEEEGITVIPAELTIFGDSLFVGPGRIKKSSFKPVLLQLQ